MNNLNSVLTQLYMELKKELAIFENVKKKEYIFSRLPNNKTEIYEVLTVIKTPDSTTFTLFNLTTNEVAIMDIPKKYKNEFMDKGVRYYV